MKNFYKITENVLKDISSGKISEEQVIENLSASVRERFDLECCIDKFNRLCWICDCESPIEQYFAYALEEKQLRNWMYFNPRIDFIEMNTQETIVISNSKYRVDFLLSVWYPEKHSGKNFVIECDGHDFHEKTKEQAQKDKKRDRELVSSGYVVLRFTGSEIIKSPHRCVLDVMKAILQYSN